MSRTVDESPRGVLRIGRAGRTAVAAAGAAVVAMAVALGFGDGAGGSVTTVAVPVLRLLGEVAAIGCIGAVLAASLLLPIDGERLGTNGVRAVRDASLAAGIWALAALAGAAATAAVVLDVPVWRIASRPAELASVTQLWTLAVSAVLAAVLSAVLTAVRSVEGASAALVLAVAAVVPPLLSGHAAAGAAPVLATATLVVHVLAATLWVGGLGAVAVYGRGLGTALRASVTRFSRIALGCAAAVGLTGVVSAGIHLAGPGGGIGDALGALGTAYGVVVLAKSAAFVALVAAGWWHRRRTLPGLAGDAAGPFRRLVAVELIVMALAVGLAVALSRTP